MTRPCDVEADDAHLESIHPGEILAEEFMKPLGVSQNRLSREIGVPVSRVADIVAGGRSNTADTAVRLAGVFGTSAEMWMALQADYASPCAANDRRGSRQDGLMIIPSPPPARVPRSSA